MMKSRLLALGILAAATSQALAQDFIFGFSGGTVNILTLHLSGGSTVGIDTGYNASGPTWLGLNQGWWSGSFTNSDDNDNTFTGTFDDVEFLRSFFTFDLSTIDLGGETLVGATLEFPSLYTITGPGSLELFDVSTDTTTLNTNDGSSAGIFGDLGTGGAYGSKAYAVADSGTPSFIDLTPAALAEIDFAIGKGYFSIGGKYEPTGAVPEPASMLVLGLGAAAVLRRKLRR